MRPVQLWYKHPLQDLGGARAREVELEEEAGRNHEDEDGDEDLQLPDLEQQGTTGVVYRFERRSGSFSSAS
jgi:hypothetical protein